ncbi:exodeoxyribonuclease VII large subunit [Planctobacterium marinum]|uniref:Exodeoxyribonuclease 7 large subunit n=1 Tax=Planctobacterium marinum TaxID=1631968 RepID=A0AA48KTR8_9ALTE|nr:exodeoxyribonuclease 7 large subunit [Planctobacterium marinum]
MQSRSDIFTVSKLNRFAKHILESEIGSIWISAEISNFVAASSGHWYFTLKDARAQVKAAMFKGANRKVRVRPKEGDKVLVRGDISLYEARGDYQLIASHLEPDGEGDLKAQFEQLKARLSAEGLFDPARKRALPEKAKRIGVITSPTGAAVRDIITVFQRRNPAIEVIIYPAQVQGASAHNDLIKALQLANEQNQVDAIIIGRGGGSMEDLWCFNHESLARTIATSQIPVVSAVGHEIDFTIADFVADLRAPTPSAAAEMLSYSNDEAIKHLTSLQRQLNASFVHLLQDKRHVLQQKRHSLERLHPEYQLREQWQTLDRLTERLNRIANEQLLRKQHQLQALNNKIQHNNPAAEIKQRQQTLNEQNNRLSKSLLHLINAKRQQFASQCHLLDTVSPLATMTRGYSITFKEGEIVKSAKSLSSGDEVTTRFADGEVRNRII